MKFSGRNRSENVGTSNEKISENLIRRKTKVSWGRFVRPGLGGPKARPKGVVDGQPVNIPAPIVGVMRTQKDKLSGLMDMPG